jgi:hypothetical protein
MAMNRVEVIKSVQKRRRWPHAHPNLNAYAERWMRNVCRR